MNPEYLSTDILEEDFLRTFSPYHYVQKVLGSCRVDAKNRFVTPPNIWQKLYTVVTIALITTIFYVAMTELYVLYVATLNLFRWLFLFALAQLCVFFSNVINARFLNNKENVQFYIKIQEIERLLKINKNATLNRVQYRVNVYTLLVMIVGFLTVLVSNITQEWPVTILSTVFLWCETITTVETAHCSNFIFYFSMRIRFVNAILLNYLEGGTRQLKSVKNTLVFGVNPDYLRYLAAKTHTFKSSETEVYLREIISAFGIYNALYKFQCPPRHRSNASIELKMNPEYLSTDILEEDFLRTFSPYHSVQKVYGSCRVDAKNRFVTAPTIWQKLYTVLTMAIVLTIYYVTMSEMNVVYVDKQNLFHWMIVFAIAQLAVFFSNMIHVRFLNDKTNVQLFIKNQEIERRLKIDKYKTLNRVHYRVHLCTLIFINTFLVTVLVSFLFCDWPLALLIAGFAWCETLTMVEISYCSNLIFYFAVRIRFVNAILVNYLEGEIEHQEPLSHLAFGVNYNYLRYLAAKTHRFRSSETDVYLREIIKGFDIYNALYKFQMFLFCTKLFAYTLISFQYITVSLKDNAFDIVQFAIIVTMMSLNFMMLLFLCIRYEIFFRSIQKTKCLAISIMAINLNGPLREKAKRMYNIIEEIPPCFSVYGMWQMDGRVLLSLFNVITSFLVTLLQFAVL